MEEQPDVEPRNQDQMEHERERAEDEWRSWQRGQVRNTLHLVSAAAQWILLLACLIYLGINSLRPSTVRVQVQPIVCWPVKLCESIEGVAMNLTPELGSIQIRNGSIMITCDGLYLVSLKGTVLFPDPGKKDSLKMTLWKTDKTNSWELWK
ncbi:TNFL4 factor, partial [Crotophaga sulcirostris]|nr:TNFL4 factor [Crotophaga sulcirostris]